MDRSRLLSYHRIHISYTKIVPGVVDAESKKKKKKLISLANITDFAEVDMCVPDLKEMQFEMQINFLLSLP